VIGTDSHKLERALGQLASVGRLTPKERRVVIAMVEGLSTAAIAKRLQIKPETVRTHMRRIFSKLVVSKRAELLARVLRCVLEEDVPRRE
jgi:DNA-binding CsgD family transcriptional regulator